EVPSDQSSSTDSIHTIVHPDHQISEHNSKWTKDHPFENIIGELDRPVSKRLQLHEQALFCYYDAFLTAVEPKTYKDALTQSFWIEAMQEELNEFEHLGLDELGGTDIAKITRKRSKPDKHGHGNGKSAQEPGFSSKGIDKSKITRKQSKTGKHEHEKRKSTKEARDSKPKPEKVKLQSKSQRKSKLWLNLGQFSVNKSQPSKVQISNVSFQSLQVSNVTQMIPKL
ncbi:hypothetical protein Tco_1434696, partial [Tanacetum coccineum]